MSETIKQFSIPEATRYNARSTYILPAEVIEAYPGLRAPQDSEEYAWEVLKAQGELGFNAMDKDGKLGYYTYTSLLARCAPVNADYIVAKGCRIPLPKRAEYRLISFDEAGGLDLHRFGNFSERKEQISAVCLHWGGLNPQHCFNCFASDARKVSSHFLIGLTDGEPTVYQVLDIAHKAWHGGKVNDFTVGVDICQSPVIDWLGHYQSAGYDVGVIDNETGRGGKQLLSLDPRIAEAAEAFIGDLLRALGLDLLTPVDHKVYRGEELKAFTVFGHHHANARKYDVAVWWEDIYPEDANV
jgi:hypothetical protein